MRDKTPRHPDRGVVITQSALSILPTAIVAEEAAEPTQHRRA
ncbi:MULTISPECIES: hypothetical protein [Rhodopseudomonas]|nr:MULTISPECIES: hypothetical protein [Rhodopseudomonas]MDF3810108.1 hypothetical protein [Rhodopseudomonas sp. BAL398]WOK18785.1 hypothetical protein RBJ75_04445 [Rhodopseudomonas sp. BAL398]